MPHLATIFDVNFLRRMCSMHERIGVELSAFDNYTPYRNIWSIANFVSCLSPNFLFNCTELNEADVDTVRQLIEYCIPLRDQLITCKTICKDEPTCSACRGETFLPFIFWLIFKICYRFLASQFLRLFKRTLTLTVIYLFISA